MHATIRRYEGLIPEKNEELVNRVREGFVPIVSNVGGLISFVLIDAGDGVVATISSFETEAAAEASNKAAASWVKDNLAEFSPSPPQITAGQVRVDIKS